MQRLWGYAINGSTSEELIAFLLGSGGTPFLHSFFLLDCSLKTVKKRTARVSGLSKLLPSFYGRPSDDVSSHPPRIRSACWQKRVWVSELLQ
jgi:hypothetical protein